MIRVYKNENVSVCASYALPYNTDFYALGINYENEESFIRTLQKKDEALNKSVTSKNLSVEDKARECADKMIESATSEANQILESAKEEAGRLYENAKKDGYKAGFAEGTAQAERYNAQQIEQIENLSNLIHRESEQINQECWENIKCLALQAAKKVIGETLPLEDVMMAVLKNTAVNLPKTEKIKLILSDREYNIATADPEAIVKIFQGSPQVNFVREPHETQGRMIIVTPDLEADVSLCKQFEQIDSVFRQI